MILATSAILGGLGLLCLLYRRTLLGAMIGIQLMGLGATLAFVLCGALGGAQVQGHVFGLFVTLIGVAQLVAGYALAVRLFYLKQKAGMDEIRSLRH